MKEVKVGSFILLKFLTCRLIIAALLVGSPAQAKSPPDTQWTTFLSVHFRVHYPQSYEKFAKVLARNLEDAYSVLSKDLHWELSSPADVVVRGDTDLANGLTSVFPLNRIEVFPVPFQGPSFVGEYDDWIRILAVHELTHLIANDTTRGFFDVGRWIVGSAAKMNIYQPTWLIEGLAVYEETLRSGSGRGRSSFVDMVLRTASAEHLLDSPDELLGITLDRLNDGNPFWPGPVAPYIFGYAIHEMMVERHGGQAPGDLSWASAGRIPFFINGAAKNVLGENFYELWLATLERLNQVSARELATIRKVPVSAARPLTQGGRSSSGLVASEDGSLFWIRDSYAGGQGISSLDLGSGKTRDLSTWRFPGGNSLRLKEGLIAYSRLERVDEFNVWSDAYVWDLSLNREIRLTDGMRASQPDFSPDFRMENGKWSSGSVVYVKNLDSANQALVRYDGKAEEILFQGKDFERISFPAWGRGAMASWVVFALKPRNQEESLWAIPASSHGGKPVRLNGSVGKRVDRVSPSWTPSGDLIFSSSETGIYNIYRWKSEDLRTKLNGSEAPLRSEALTNLETGAFFPAMGSGKLYAMVYEASGLTVSELGAAPSSPSAGKLAPLRDQLRSLDASKAGPTLGESGEPGFSDASGYSVFPSIWPKYVLPFGTIVPYGWVLGLQTSGFDALELHKYDLKIAYDSRATFPVYDFKYQYDSLYPTIAVERIQENRYLSLFGISNNVDTTQLSIEYPLGLWSVGFGGAFLESRFLSLSTNSGGLQAHVFHGNMISYPASIDPSGGESGHRVDFAFTGYLGGDQVFPSFELRAEQRMPLWRQHFLRVLGSGFYSANQNLSANYHVGGGESYVGDFQPFLVRGYRPDSIFGRSLATLNLEYWMPLKDVFRGLGTFPAFYERAKLKVFVDTGSGEFVAGAADGFSSWPTGVGAQVLQDFRFLYRYPLTLALGVDWGINPNWGGSVQFVFGVFSHL